MSHPAATAATTMKAIVQDAYGPPDILQLKEIAAPTPRDNEVLVRIHATTVTPADCAFRKGDPFATRFFNGLRRPKFIPGDGLAGTVQAVGKDVRRFKPGDQVFGSAGPRFGAHAEYKVVPEDGVLATVPAGLTFAQAVAVADGALTALPFLRDVAKLHSGQTILINGASGSVGAAAVQLAKHYGADVAGVSSTTNTELVTFLGADEVIDYTQEDFTTRGETYDVVFDAVGKSSFHRSKPALKSGGIYLTTVPSLAIMLQMLWTSKLGSKKAKIAFTGLTQTSENLTFLKELTEAGVLRPVIDRHYPLEQIAEAHRYVEKGHKKGSVIIAVLA